MTQSENGMCQCGCGDPAPIAKTTRGPLGHVKGQPVRFISGHNNRRDPVERFWRHVQKTDGCWLWTGSVGSHGYGQFAQGATRETRMVLAHRFSYELHHGPIPDGLYVDHVKDRGCTSPLCVNPAHLEAVTNAENLRRGNSTKLSAAQVREIRALAAQWVGSQRGFAAAMAPRYGVTPVTVRTVATRGSWRDIEESA